VPLSKRFTLKVRDALATFVRLAQPHADHSIAASVPDSVVNQRGVVLEVTLQGGFVPNRYRVVWYSSAIS